MTNTTSGDPAQDSSATSAEADAYNHACELMEAGFSERAKRGVVIGTEGSLCDGIDWLFGQIKKLEASATPPAAPIAPVSHCIKCDGNGFVKGYQPPAWLPENVQCDKCHGSGAPAIGQQTDSGERALFEARVRKECGFTDEGLEKSADGRYAWGRTADMFWAWKARAHLSATNSEALAPQAAPDLLVELLNLLIESQESIGGDWRARRDAAVIKAQRGAA